MTPLADPPRLKLVALMRARRPGRPPRFHQTPAPRSTHPRPARSTCPPRPTLPTVNAWPRTATTWCRCRALIRIRPTRTVTPLITHGPGVRRIGDGLAITAWPSASRHGTADGGARAGAGAAAGAAAGVAGTAAGPEAGAGAAVGVEA